MEESSPSTRQYVIDRGQEEGGGVGGREGGRVGINCHYRELRVLSGEKVIFLFG